MTDKEFEEYVANFLGDIEPAEVESIRARSNRLIAGEIARDFKKLSDANKTEFVPHAGYLDFDGTYCIERVKEYENMKGMKKLSYLAVGKTIEDVNEWNRKVKAGETENLKVMSGTFIKAFKQL
ncbi:hypothetical protein ACLH2J_01810 [Klebsiella michiganensis]|uniref:hypothetical protein n=1 Tax=Klebsiella michiganensis TaxID=1134687 RepID=UPI0039836AFE